MHISEGVLSPVVLGCGAALAVVGVALGLRKMEGERLLTTAVLASAFFVGSLVHVPVGPGNVHLILNGLLGLFLGWGVFPALLVALLLQAVLFQYGGLVVLGVNVFDMAFPALLCHLAFLPLIRKGGRARTLGAFLCGSLSVAGAALLTSLALALSGEAFVASAALLFAAHLPIILIEGILSVAAISFIARTRPHMLDFAGKPEQRSL
ncbi:cobalt transporter CbiM [Desulfovibrio sp. OttesenSCG-928-G15]|nr:cobalt transporter CbiM [Desulfovibrio sp. OttesenSCG-928-G15]